MARPARQRLDPAFSPWRSGGPRETAHLSWVAACAYAVLAVLAVAVATFRGTSLLTTAPWLPFPAAARTLASVAGGLVVAALTIWVTPLAVRSNAGVRALHAELRPTVRDASGATLLFMAVASGTGEELFFRGALVPWIGAVASSVAFGLVHHVRGPARWIWVGWASAMGFVLAILFQATGTLAGSILAHVAMNAANLRFVRDHDPSPTERALGGLLKKSSRC